MDFLTPAERRAKALAAIGRKPREAAATGPASPPPPPLEWGGDIVRHLIYFVMPWSGKQTWRHNLTQLLARIDLFNGKRIIAIAKAPHCDPPSAVRDFISGHGFEVLEFPNDPKTGEVVAFLPMLDRVKSTAANECVFYAHAKGVKHPDVGDPTTAVHRWATAQYETCLDHWPSVQAALESHTFAGSFRRGNRGRSRGINWHYSGTFFWFRSARLFTLPNWRNVPRMYGGVEFWPGRIADRSQGACLFHDDAGNLYDVKAWDRVITPQLDAWKATHGTGPRICEPTDKGTVHSYEPLYRGLLSRFATDPLSLLEVGVRSGASLKMWMDWFPHAAVTGIDIDGEQRECWERHGVADRVLVGDATDRNWLDDTLWTRQYDVIIDDASHEPEQQVATLGLLSKRLKDRGLYVIEDVQSDDAIQQVRAACPIGWQFEVYDMRSLKGRYDDVMVVMRKE